MGAAQVYQVYSPYSEDEIAAVGYEQQADVMVLTHLNHPIQALRRFEHTRWTLDAAPIASAASMVTGLAVTPSFTVTEDAVPKEWVYTVTSINPDTGEESLPAESVGSGSNDLGLRGNFNSITFTPIAGVEEYPIYKGDTGSLGYIGTASSNANFLDYNYLPDYSDSYPRSRNPFGTEGNYPATVTFYQQRMMLARTLKNPAGLYGSQSANFFNFNSSRPVQPSDAVTFGVLARRVNAIQHLVPMKRLIAFTTDAIFAISGQGGGPLAADDIDISPEGYRGCSAVRPVVVEDIAFYNPARSAVIRTLGYQFDRDGYRGNNISVFAKHFFKGFRLVDMCWLNEPTETLWCVRSDGKLLALTWMEEQDVWGWSLCYTDGFVESCCVVGETDEDALYVVVRRTINGTVTRHVERMATANWTDVRDAVFLDASRAYSGAPITSVNVEYLGDPQTVDMLVDGSALLAQPVVNGVVNLPAPATHVIVGLGYEGWIRTLPLAPALNTGSIKGQRQALGDLPTVTVLKTRGIELALSKASGPDPADPTMASDEGGQFYTFRTRTDEPLASIPSLYSGSLVADAGIGDWTEETTGLVIRQRYPLPMTITGVVMDLQAGG